MAASVLENMARHARDAFPRECCGALLGPAPRLGSRTRRIVATLPARNEAESASRYLLGPAAVRALEAGAAARRLCVVGYYHSHPGGVALPSDTDRELAWPWLVYVIQPVDEAGSAAPAAWILEDGRNGFVRCPVSCEEREV